MRKRRGRFETQTRRKRYREEGHVKMEAEECCHKPRNTRRNWKKQGKSLPLNLQRECGPANALISDL